MSIHPVLTDQPNQAHLSDTTLARELGQRLWRESDLQFDWSGIESVTTEFAQAFCGTVIEKRAATLLQSALLTNTMNHAVQSTFMPVIMAAFTGTLEWSHTPPAPVPAKAPAFVTLNPLASLAQVQQQYLSYVHTFQQFQNPKIKQWVAERVAHGRLLWREPYIQLSRHFLQEKSLEELEAEGLLHPETLKCFTVEAGNREAAPIHPYKHQLEAIRHALADENVIVATGTGSGKSFAFGIPIVSECLRLRAEGVAGIKALIVYPMNALANSQYDDFARRLAGSGLKLALYTGDTLTNPEKALEVFRQITGREEPYDSEVISREAIQNSPPDILMTNYVMLELLLTRFEDRTLFPPQHAGTLRFFVLDEVHTFTGKRGADVACLIRRLKQHTGTIGKLRCIATSATVQSEANDTRTEEEGEDADELIADFATRLFGEPFNPAHVINESYLPPRGLSDELLPASIQVTDEMLAAFDGSPEQIESLRSALLPQPPSPPAPLPTLGEGSLASPPELGGIEGGRQELLHQATLYFLEHALHEGPKSLEELVERYKAQYRPEATRDDALRELKAALLVGTLPLEKESEPRLVPKLHAFFSQGRAITTCLTTEGPHLNERGELTCPTCASSHKRERPTFPLNFCRACGQEFYGVAIVTDNTPLPMLGEGLATEGRRANSLQARDLDSDEYEGQAAYLYPKPYDREKVPLPDKWLTAKKRRVKKKYADAVPQNRLYCPTCNQLDPTCSHQNKIKITIINEPFLLCPNCGILYDGRTREFNKLFTFGTVGRSTATDVLVSNTLRVLPEDKRKIIAFSDNRQDTALQAAHMNSLQRRFHFRRAVYQSLHDSHSAQQLNEMGLNLYKMLEKSGTMPNYTRQQSQFWGSRDEQAYQEYLTFAVLRDLERTHRRIHQNLEDVGLLIVQYEGLEQLAAAQEVWSNVPVLNELDTSTRYDYLYGFLDIMRKRLAIQHTSLLSFRDFRVKVLDKLNPDALVEEITWWLPIGFSDEVDSGTGNARVYRFVHPSTSIVAWTRRALELDYQQASQLIPQVVKTLAQPEVGYLNRVSVKWAGKLYMLPHELLRLTVTDETKHQLCPRCGTVHHFRTLNICTGISCTTLKEVDLSDNYFGHEYTRSLAQVVPVRAEEHSGQVDGQERRSIEERFRDPESDLNVIVCTPTMELGIDIGPLSSVYMRNVPPSPSNYAQRAGRAGRKGQASLITVFCGVGSYRGPHDQYFYRYPEKIIAGKISPPRFLLNNQALIETHIHALILETLVRDEPSTHSLKLPTQPEGLLDLTQNNYPIFADLRQELTASIKKRAAIIESAIKNAFAAEMSAFDWFTPPFVQQIISTFVERLDQSFDAWRREYILYRFEREEINRTLGREAGDRALESRRRVIEHKLEAMRQGKRHYYSYRYLSSQGFLPNYGFPRHTVSLSFYERKEEMSRHPTLALTEYAPGNFIYYRGARYEVVYGRPRTHGQKLLDFEELLVCPQCDSAYLGQSAKRAACAQCHTPLTDVHPDKRALVMPDMVARRRMSITADEEERTRRGYQVERHYSQEARNSQPHHLYVNNEGNCALTYEHNGRILVVNRGPRQAKGSNNPAGFTYCRACDQWLASQTAINKHLEENGCPRGGKADDILDRIFLFTRSNVDVITLDCSLSPQHWEGDEKYDAFYTTLLHTLKQALVISMNLAENEIDGFLANVPNEEQQRIVLYETAEGGIGAVESLTEPHRLAAVLKIARQLLHEGEEGCEKACYECLCSFYNQRDHHLLDRHLVLPFLQSLTEHSTSYSRHQTEPIEEDPFGESSLAPLLAQCDSELEQEVLQAIHERGTLMRLPDQMHKTLYKGNSPIASADFYYEPKIVVFVDGSPHHKDYVAAADKKKRKRLKGLGYRIVVIQGENITAGIEKLQERLQSS